MGFLDGLRNRDIKPLPEVQEPDLKDHSQDQPEIPPPPGPVTDVATSTPPLESPTPPEAATLGHGNSGWGEGDFPQENPIQENQSAEVVEEIADATSAEELSAAAVPDFDFITGVSNVKPPDPLTVQLLEDEAKLKGQPQAGVGQVFKTGAELDASYQKQQARNVKDRAATVSSQYAGNQPDPTRVISEEDAADLRLQHINCVTDPRLIGAKLRKFGKIFYLNPMTWDSRTADYVIKSYINGVSIKAIYEKISSPKAVFSDSAGFTTPTFRNMRAELGNIRVVDLYAFLAMSIYKTAVDGALTCLDGKRFQTTNKPFGLRVNGLAGIRKLRHDGEMHPTTFVDLIFYDELNPGSLGHFGLDNWLRQRDEAMPPTMIRRAYDTVLVKFRDRWKTFTGVRVTRRNLQDSVAGTATGHKVIKQLDDALTNRTAILDGQGRRFLLIEWPDELPMALPKFATVAAGRQSSDLKLFLRKFVELFDPAVPFNTRTIEEIRGVMSVQPVETITPVQEQENVEPLDEPLDQDADPFQ